MKKQKSVYSLLSIIFIIVNSSVASAFQNGVQTVVANGNTNVNSKAVEADKVKEEQIAALIQQFEVISRETQSFNLFSNRVYFSVLTALDLYSAAQLSDEFYERKKTENANNADGNIYGNRKPVAESYKTYLYQVVDQQKNILDAAIDTVISEHNKLTLQAGNPDAENGNNVEEAESGKTKTVFDLAGINLNSPEAGSINDLNSRLYLLVYLKSYTGYAISEIDPELAFDFYEHDPVISVDPQTQSYLSSDLAEKRASFANKLFEKEPEKAIAKLTNLKEKPFSFLTSEALAAFYRKDPKKAAQFAQKILDESFAGLDTANEEILYQKMNGYLYFLSYLKDGKLLSRNNPLISKTQALKIVDMLVNFYTSRDSAESEGDEFLYIADIISDYSPEKANLLLQSSKYQIKLKKKTSADNKTEPYTYDTPSETQSNGDGNSVGGIGTDNPPPPPPEPPSKPAPTNNKPAPEIINSYYTQALQISGYNVSDAVFVNNLIKISQVFNKWEEFEKAQSILNLAQNTISKAPATSSDYILRFNLAQAYVDSKNIPEAIKITENALGSFEYFIQGLITTSRYNRNNNDDFTDNGYELDVSLNSYYSYYLQSLISSNNNLFNALMDENPANALNLGNKFTRKESQFVFRFYVLDGYLKHLQVLNKQ